jgi:hypothetical protein
LDKGRFCHLNFAGTKHKGVNKVAYRFGNFPTSPGENISSHPNSYPLSIDAQR